jgi:plastocyanin
VYNGASPWTHPQNREATLFRMRSASVFLIALGILAAARPPDPPVPTTTSSSSSLDAGTGVIEGVVAMRRAPQRRAAARYQGRDAAREIQEIPALVFVKGPIVASAAGGGSAVMGQRDKLFDPALLVVPVGTVVEFPNHDPVFHNVFSYSSAARFDLGRYPQGESKEVRFDEPGIVKVYCEVHETMRAAIVVVEHPYWAYPDETGRFRIEGVPAGTHTLVAWHTDRREREVDVTVTAGRSTRIELEL